jgi:hypothetical protein
VDRAATVRELWALLAAADLEPLRRRLRPPDARSRAVQDGPWTCESADAIIEVMARHLAAGLCGTVEEAIESGDRVVVAFRPDRHDPGAWRLEDGVRWVLVTFDGELVSELRGCLTRADAIAYAGA